MRVLVLGTSSAAGKTTLCAMLCRHYAREGMDPVPFKASNLSLNSYATKDGGEIGMGQAFQAWSAGLEPETDMNPVLLKPSGNGIIQAVVNGRPFQDYGRGRELDRETAMSEAVKAYGRLSEKHGFVICEGSGSPAELNLMDRDMANTGLMDRTDVPAILVGDIERGGVFAAIYGTWRIMPDRLKPRLKGFVINRFRGDGSILKPGIDRIEELTGMKCLGVLPYLSLRFPEEDSYSSSEGRLEGTTVREAFLRNIDEFTDAAERSGFDFDALTRIAKGRSSSRRHPHGADLGVLRDCRIHGHRLSADHEDVGVGKDAA
ncbi:MAG: cobyric acid synthase [Candidatus Methanomethylophilaceae archaeon]|nr:cobyric acid synthase [Candidatus Methanomethylophilaceae archaeon]